MELAWSDEDIEFRDEVREFLRDRLTPDLRQAGRLMTSVYSDHDASMAWHKRLTAIQFEFGSTDHHVARYARLTRQ